MGINNYPLTKAYNATTQQRIYPLKGVYTCVIMQVLALVKACVVYKIDTKPINYNASTTQQRKQQRKVIFTTQVLGYF